MHNLVDHLLGQVHSYRLLIQDRLSQQGIQHTFHLPHIGRNAIGDVFNDILWHFHAAGLQLAPQNPHSRFHIRHLQTGRQAPFETGHEMLLNTLQLHRSFLR